MRILKYVYVCVVVTWCCADEDRMGPILLASLLAVAIIVNFGIKLYDYST